MLVRGAQQYFSGLLATVFFLVWLQVMQVTLIYYRLLLLVLESPDDLLSPWVPMVEVTALCELVGWVANCWMKPPSELEPGLVDVRLVGRYQNQ